jgi:hypothetical protein
MRRGAFVVLAVFVVGLILILVIPAIDRERANFLLAWLAVLLAFVFGMAPYMEKYPLPEEPLRRHARFLLMVVALGVAVVALLIVLVRPAVAVSIPGAIRIDGHDQLTPTTPATIVFLEPTPDRQNLGLKLYLDDYIGSGNCTTPATLTLTPLKGGQEGAAVQVPRPGTISRDPDEVAIPIGGSVQDLRITVALHSGVGCKLRLVVREAVFHG